MEIQNAAMYLINNLTGNLIAIIVIAGFIRKVKPIGAAIKRFCFAELYAANDRQDQRLDNLEMQQLKQIICDRRFPPGERLNAVDEYIKRGGNGEMMARGEALKKKHIAELETEEQP
jgi:hypothetical protein